MGSPAALIMQKKAHIFRFVPGFRHIYYNVIKNRDLMLNYFTQNIEKRKETMDLDADTEPVDYVEAFLRKQHELNQKGEKHNFT